METLQRAALVLIVAWTGACVAEVAPRHEAVRTESADERGPGVAGDGDTCCICYHGVDSACAAMDYFQCVTSAYSGGNCEYVGGACQDRHIDECNAWLDAQTQCDRKYISPRDQPISLFGCEEVYFDDDGHGCGLEAHYDRITACMDAGTCEANVLLEGCSEFEDFVQLDAFLQSLQATLGPDQSLTVSGNQCTSHDECQTAQCEVSVTCDAIEINLPECWGECPMGAEGETAVCGDIANPTQQVCCCDANSKCSFHDGLTCPPVVDPAICKTLTTRSECSSMVLQWGESCTWATPPGRCEP